MHAKAFGRPSVDGQVFSHTAWPQQTRPIVRSGQPIGAAAPVALIERRSRLSVQRCWPTRRVA
jgi:hypothetical protein